MYAYPQRPGAVGTTPASAFGQQQQQQPVYVPPPPPVAAPGPGLANAASGSITTLRLKLSDAIRIDPPVAVSAALLPSSGPHAPACPDLSRERQLVEAAEAQGRAQGGSQGGGCSPDVEAYLAGIKAGELPVDAAIKALVAKGVSPSAAALGVVYGRAGRGGSEKVSVEFASGLEQLTTMGFSLPLAAGALARHKGDLEAATESCLATAT